MRVPTELVSRQSNDSSKSRQQVASGCNTTCQYEWGREKKFQIGSIFTERSAVEAMNIVTFSLPSPPSLWPIPEQKSKEANDLLWSTTRLNNIVFILYWVCSCMSISMDKAMRRDDYPASQPQRISRHVLVITWWVEKKHPDITIRDGGVWVF